VREVDGVEEGRAASFAVYFTDLVLLRAGKRERE
jgi:hypothetical protein